MKIGIITSGNDTLTLFRFLQGYDHEYIIYYDFLNRPYGDKTFECSLEQIQKGIGFLIKKGCEKIILPPIYELALLNASLEKGYSPAKLEKGALWDRDLLTTSEKELKSILPLFQTYLHNLCFTQSLIGKLGIFGDYADIQVAQKLINNEAKNYKLNDHQKNIKKPAPHRAAGFNFPFNYRSKETALWKYYLNELSYSEPMVNAVIKHDLRYFKDANIDTAIPLNYGYFNYQNTISRFFNHKKTRFHKIEKLEEIFTVICPTGQRGDGGIGKPYSVNIFYTDHCDFLQRSKKLMRLLQRGKQIEINFEEIK